MSKPLPHTKEVAAWANQYLTDTLSQINRNCADLQNSTFFRDIYWNCLGIDAVLSGLANSRWKPDVKSHRSIALRIPALVACGQATTAKIELRRFIELSFWVIYFTDHPVEWREFEKDPSAGISQSLDLPIQFSARRNIKYYFDYAVELFSSEPSGLAKESVIRLRALTKDINPIVHPAKLIAISGNPPPFDDLSEQYLKEFRDLQKDVFAQSSIALAGMFRKNFDKFPPFTRGHFDRLLGKSTSDKIKSSHFGLPD